MNPPPYTVPQVLKNLVEMVAQLQLHPVNLEGGTGWVRLQCEDILKRGIENTALTDAADLLNDIMQDTCNAQDEAEKWLRAYAPQYLAKTTGH